MVLTEIEKERQETIKHNLKELEAVGIDPARLKSMAMSLFGSKPKASGESTKEGNNKVGHGADPDYIPPEGVEILSSCSDNDESFRSQAKKVIFKCKSHQFGEAHFLAASTSLYKQLSSCAVQQFNCSAATAEAVLVAAVQLVSTSELGYNFLLTEKERKQSTPERFKDTHIRHRLGEAVWINDKAKKHHTPRRQHRQIRVRMNGHMLPPEGGHTASYVPLLQQPSQSLTSSKDSINQQRSGHVRYVPNGRVREMSKGSGISSSVTSSVGIGSEGSDMLSSKLSAAPPEQQKQIFGERLYPLVHKQKPDLAAKITGMILEMDNAELLLLLESPDLLVTKVEEA
ncbi:hypothetical protein RHMOL_Rhmol02G0119000 [Rhododendron molle]|uniref:Uncharacterized protein n=2 Tax=Rhododendron molle TaxID=49168 RepID=A0ACC0PPH5_RHOML|nr:hypothetical protein RHMOL_Rhmol02G0119000 [Rhododendron molle]KAI8567401.1 hypothetical protein RHMOL_Rhmol02G0119000 [Rhododendron molle]